MRQNYLTIAQAAERLKVSRQYIWKLISEKKLPATLVGKYWLIRKREIDRRINPKPAIIAPEHIEGAV